MRQLLLCPPDFYGIEYEINPWMSRRDKADSARARAQWQQLHDTLQQLNGGIELIAPQPKLPDMVFTANAGLVVGSRFIRSNFRYPQRQGEAGHFEEWFRAHGYQVLRLPEPLVFEGEGDALFCGETLFCGYRFRSDIRSHQQIGEWLNCLVVSVELVDPRFYHLDTCFCPLPDGTAVWYPGAFDDYGQRAIRQHIADSIEVFRNEALRFACNAVVLDQEVVLSEGCPSLAAALSKRGYHVSALPMSEYLKAGGACKCLTLFLPQR